MVIDNLCRRELVFRIRDEKDRRYYKVHLTKKGTDLIRSVFPAHAKDISRLFSILNEEEQKTLGKLCKKIGLGDEKTVP